MDTIDRSRTGAPSSTGLEPYDEYAIEDYGTLSELTADLHIELPTQVARMAAAALGPSSPIPGRGPGTGGNVVNGVQNAQGVAPKSGTLPGQGGTLPAGPTPGGGGGGGVAPATETGGAPGGGGAGGGGTAGGGGGGGGGKLPFTGYGVLLTAAVGASFAGAGAAVRSRLRRDSDAPETGSAD